MWVWNIYIQEGRFVSAWHAEIDRFFFFFNHPLEFMSHFIEKYIEIYLVSYQCHSLLMLESFEKGRWSHWLEIALIYVFALCCLAMTICVV
jgi:hypothetical protein